jgi:hypothetical protein
MKVQQWVQPKEKAFFFWNSNRQMVSLRGLKFGGTCLHWPKPSDKSDISLKTETLGVTGHGVGGGELP